MSPPQWQIGAFTTLPDGRLHFEATESLYFQVADSTTGLSFDITFTGNAGAGAALVAVDSCRARGRGHDGVRHAPQLGGVDVIGIGSHPSRGLRKGIVINIPEMRVYYFPPEGSEYAGRVVTHPLGIGREGWSTPLGKTTIVRKKADPTWTPPASIRKEHAAQGEELPDVVPAGPDNPLGQHALYLGMPSYLLHGTNKPAGIGLKVSHGCIRLYPEDIASLFSMVEPGTPVNIISEPYKIGREGNTLYIEAHPPDASGDAPVRSFTPWVEAVIGATESRQSSPVDWDRAQKIVETADGIPEPIGVEIRDDE